MLRWLVKSRKELAGRISYLRQPLGEGTPAIMGVAHFVLAGFAVLPLAVLMFLCEIPIHLTRPPMGSFALLARRDYGLSYVDSYAVHLRKYQAAVAAVLAAFIFLVIQFYFFAASLINFGRPTVVTAVSTSVSINPTWDRQATKTITVNGTDPECTPPSTSYLCASAVATTLTIGYADNSLNGCPYTITADRAGLKFSLASIPNNATVTKVELLVNVSSALSGTYTVLKIGNDSVDSQACSTMWSLFGGVTIYSSYTNWDTTGQKTLDLGSTAVSDVQARLTGSDILPLSITTNDASATIDSVDHGTAANRPILRVSYTTPPEAPTNSSHSANTTSTIAWTWTDNGSAETRYDVHDVSHASVTGCTNLAANSQSCTETGLSANTQYTRHPNVTDAQGNTDGPSAAAYTSIETPSGVSFSNVTTTGLTAAATGTLSNLTDGSSGLYFQESVTSTNSGWTQTNSWTKSSLTANTQYSVQAKARNGNSDETSLTAAAATYTLSLTPNVASTRTTSTWYTTAGFPFTNAAGWGSGGVQYYRYAWDRLSTHTFTGAESTWSNANANCPDGTCADAGTTLTKTATAEADNWYLHVQSFNGDGVANGTADYGPYFFNGTAPAITDNQSGDATPRKGSGMAYDVDFAKSSAGPQLDYAQYAVYGGANKSGALLKDWTNIFTTDTNAYTTDWTIEFTALQEGTNYVSVRAVALDGLSTELDDVFTIVKDTTAPTISAFRATTTTSAATVTWTTNEATSTQLEWGTTTSYGNTTTLDPALSTSHSVGLSGLAANATFHARALSVDQAGNNAASSDLSFTTEANPQTVITGVQVTKNSPTSVTVTWTTNEPATSKVRYGPTTDYGGEVADLTLTTSHAVTISGLTPGATYHYEVISTGSTTDIDADATFTTDEAPATTVTTISNVRIVAGETIMTIFWTTNEPATSTVRYGPTAEYGATKSDADLVTSHRIQLTGLSSGSTYHLRLVSVGTTTAAGDDQTVTTNTPESTTNRAISPTVFAPTIRDGADPVITVTGVARGNQTVKIYIDGRLVKSVALKNRPTVTKSFALTVLVGTLSRSTHVVTVQAVDGLGRTSRPTKPFTFRLGGRGSKTSVRLSTATRYTVIGGDSLWRLAERYLGDGRAYPKLVAANVAAHPSLATNPGAIQPGWLLTIPGP